jgi:prophage regulatory protein
MLVFLLNRNRSYSMQTALLRLPEVIKITGRSRSSIYAGIKDGSFVQPIKIGERAIAFVQVEVEEWVQGRIAESRQDEG